jgi:hypothetical protein
MAETNAAATAAATKIQAIARGNRGRKKFKDYVIKMIEEMMAAQDPKHAVAAQPKPPPEKPRSGRVFRLSRISADEDDYVEDTDNEMDVDVDEGFTEEEIITVVIDDDQYTDHTREELVAEFVTYGDLSPPPPPKTGFELYNAQLKAAGYSKPVPTKEQPTTSDVEEPKPISVPSEKQPMVSGVEKPKPMSVPSKQQPIVSDVEQPKPKPVPSKQQPIASDVEEKKPKPVPSKQQPKPKPDPSKKQPTTSDVEEPKATAEATKAKGWRGLKKRLSWKKRKVTSESAPAEPTKPISKTPVEMMAYVPAATPQESITLNMNTSGHSNDSLDSSSHHVRKVAAGWWGTGGKTKSEKPNSIAESAPAEPTKPISKTPVEIMAYVPAATPQESITLNMNTSGHSNDSLDSSSHHVRKVATGWWGTGGKTKSEKPNSIAESAPAVASLQSTTPSSKGAEDTAASVAAAPVAYPKGSLASKGKTATAASLPSAIPNSETPEKTAESTPAATPQESTTDETAESTLAAKPPTTPISKNPKAVTESPSARGFWASKDKSAKTASLPAAIPNLETPEETAESTTPPTTPSSKKSKASVASPSALGFWAFKDKQATDELAPAAPPFQSPTRRWKKPKAVAEPVSAAATQESNTPTDIDEYALAAKPQESTKRSLNSSAPSAGLEGNSSHHNNKFAVPWLKPATPKPSEREPSPPPPDRPRNKSFLVDRYLSVVKEGGSDHEKKKAQIEADRARGRWDGSGYVHGENEDGSKHKPQTNWNYLHPKLPPSPEDKIDDGVAIKLQALVRGFMARRRVAAYVDSLIEEIMRKMNADQNEEEEERRRKEEDEERRRQEEEEELSKNHKAEELRKKEENEERRRQEEEETIKRREAEEERRRKEEEEVRLRGYDDRVGLPLWWMELIPHNSLDQKVYKALVKIDNGATIIDYKMPTHGFEQRNAEPLEAVTEEDNETDDETDDENNANLDKILGNSPPAKKTAGPKQINKKSKSSAFSCMCMDAVEGVDNTTAPNAVLDINKHDNEVDADDKEDTESSERMVDREPDLQQQESVPCA